MREELITQYHQLLSADERVCSSLFSSLKAEMGRRRLVYDGRPIGVSLRPHFLERKQYEWLVLAAETVARAHEKAAAAMLSEPSRMNSIGLTDREIKLALIDPGYVSCGVTTRLDAFVHNQDVKFVEYNAENPSSLSDQQGLNQILVAVEAMRSIARQYQLQEFDPVGALISVLRSTFHEWGGHGAPNVAIVDWENLPTADEFVLIKESFTAAGIPSVICSPEQLTYEKQQLRVDGFAVDLVYKRVIIHELLERFDDTHPLIQAYIDRKVCLVNSFRAKLLHKKAVFALLTDEKNAEWFTADERDVIQRTVPWTRRVLAMKTRYRGGEVDLIEYVARHKDSFILKPNDDYGGRGISFGQQLTQAEWDDALAGALADDYVVQERVDLHTEEFPIFSESDWSFEPMFVDTNPFLFNGRVEGAMVRLSDSPVVNVTSGGGETGFYVVES